jgi:hypothetical protein
MKEIITEIKKSGILMMYPVILMQIIGMITIPFIVMYDKSLSTLYVILIEGIAIIWQLIYMKYKKIL